MNCNHVFAYWSVVPPTHYPHCGACLHCGAHAPRPWPAPYYPPVMPYQPGPTYPVGPYWSTTICSANTSGQPLVLS